MTQANDDFNSLIREAREQIEQQQYQSAIDNLNYIIENNYRNGYARFLRGKAYAQLKKYQPALIDYETALNIYREANDKKYQIYTLIELTIVYPFNGKIREGFLAQQEIPRLAKEIDISADDPLYSHISHMSQLSDESLAKMETNLQTVGSTFFWNRLSFMGKMMGYATRGKPQSYLFFLVWLLFAIPALVLGILTSPVWLLVMAYQNGKAAAGNNTTLSK